MNRRHLLFGAAAAVATAANAAVFKLIDQEPKYRIRYVKQWTLDDDDEIPVHWYNAVAKHPSGQVDMYRIALWEHDPQLVHYEMREMARLHGSTLIDPMSQPSPFKLELPRGVRAEYI